MHTRCYKFNSIAKIETCTKTDVLDTASLSQMSS